jgi:hypothetical protein
MDKSYNGWKNYATWGVALILDNDQGLHLRPVNMARRAIEDATNAAVENARKGGPLAEWDKPEHRARIALADELKEWVGERLDETVAPDCEGAWGQMAAQMVGAGLAEVDWQELAEHYLTAAKESR